MDDLGQNKRLTREQKVGVAMLFVFAILTAGLAFLQIRNTLVSPFVFRASQETDIKTLNDFQVELQNIDTDRDGINDYEELNFYTTSPYLPDTDSDGIDDKEEVRSGTDPLCPKGQSCESLESIMPSTTSSPFFSGLEGLQGGFTLPGGSNTEEMNKEVQNLLDNPQKIRQMLLQTGQVPEEELNKLDDATLRKILQEILSGSAPQNENLPENSPISVSSTVSQPNEDQNEL